MSENRNKPEWKIEWSKEKLGLPFWKRLYVRCVIFRVQMIGWRKWALVNVLGLDFEDVYGE